MRLDEEEEKEGVNYRLDADTRSCLKAGERTRAANYLRQKKQVEKSINDKDNQYQRLLSMLHQIGSTKVCLRDEEGNNSCPSYLSPYIAFTQL